MPVPKDDIVCRFIRRKDWSRRDNRPKASAFKEVKSHSALSVWHKGRLLEQNVALEDLRIGRLEGWGQAHHTVDDYLQFAHDAEEKTGQPFEVEVEWRPENEYVTEPWRKWRYAHIQVKAIKGSGKFPDEFRDKLAFNARTKIPPDEFLNPDNQNLS